MTFLAIVLALIFGICAAVVLLSYTIAWYEYSNRDPALLANRFAPKRLIGVIWAMALETLLLGITVILHPLGWLPAKVKKPDKPQTPILLLHGLFHNRSCWSWLRLYLRLKRHTAVYSMNLAPWRDIESLTEEVAKKVDEIRHNLGEEKVALVGHSMGGLIARNYLQIRGGAGKVSHLVMLGTPNDGSKLAPFALTPLGKLLVPGSEFLQRLATAALPADTLVTSIYSRLDNMVIPFASCRIEGGNNIEFKSMGHASQLYHPRVAAAVLAALNPPEEEA
ncbi:MAG: alpha/beta fold hydrolase [Desulfuromonadales bacterium]|nr:alpha/beta fold hydrolase [Desulfuromonadales bacterium]NIR33413.1 alpha/beta fold hydrolase [Desulfuromonadales bacterium]NIS43404.1 alpha/beta fold hydrolase [Desulfuromonadales bacterium]